MSAHFFEIELLYGGVAVFNNPVVGVPVGISDGAGAVAVVVAAGIEGQGGLDGWKGIDWARGEG